MEIPHQFLAMTPDPLDASAAAVNFLFALGPLTQQPHPPILIPVYQADAARIPTPAAPATPQPPDTNAPPTYTITLPGIAAPPTITLPEKVAADPLYLDWLLSRLPNYQRGAVLRLHAQPQPDAIQEVLNAWYNYLTSPKARTPIPQPLIPPRSRHHGRNRPRPNHRLHPRLRPRPPAPSPQRPRPPIPRPPPLPPNHLTAPAIPPHSAFNDTAPLPTPKPNP